ncbi:MAG: cache domain-containing protein, partial [Treponema sp.]|nr:cache domain-containing protein [Treponema sp.]
MKKMHHMSLMTELLIGTIGSILIVATFLSISFFSVFMYNIRKSTISSVTQTMETLDMHILGILGEYNDKVKTISNVVPVLESREQIRDVLVNLGKGLPSEALLYYATAEQIWDGGTLISHSGWEAPSDFDMQSRLWHKNALSNTNKICYTTPFVDVNTGKLIVTVSYRVFDNGGRIMGVAAFDIVLDALSEAVRNISLSPNSRINIVTKDGLYITNERSSAIMNENYFDTTNFKTYTKSDYLNGMSKSFTERGTFYGVHPIENTDWYIVAEGPISDFASEFERIMMQVLLTLVVLVAVMVGGAVFLSKKVSNCFNFIAAGCEVIAKGDFTKK